MSDDEESEEDLEDVADKDSLTRRSIYLQRLLGDDIFVPKKVNVRRDSLRGVFRFSFYTLVATLVIISRARIDHLGRVNRGIADELRGKWFEHAPVRKYFDDITNTKEIVTWAKKVLFNTQPTQDGSSSLNFLTYNRVTPTRGVCMNHSAITMTVRRVAVTGQSKDTTTKRFKELVPAATKVLALPAGISTQYGSEDTGKTDDWHYSSPVHCQDWAAQGGGQTCKDFNLGYNNAGGYVAVITTSPAIDNKPGKTYVHLIQNFYLSSDRLWLKTKPNTEDYTTGLCDGGLPRSSAYPVDTFDWDDYFDQQTGSIAFEFTLYNANFQSMSQVAITFDANMVGYITNKEIVVQTLMLDTFHPFIKYCEVIYLICTLLYFLELCYRSWKSYPKTFRDVWFYINVVSIISSLISLVTWYLFEPELQEFRTLKRGFEDPYWMSKIFMFFKIYMWSSAVAILTIYLRVLQFLSNTKMRVMLLWKTLSAGAGKIIIYVLYIGIVLWGFIAFANTHFAAHSSRFATFPATFLACFEMFFGKVDAMATIDDSQTPLKRPFYLLFMLFFYFISVQMFNAIVNYSYNSVSAEMQPQFDREDNERKRKELQQKVSGKKSAITRIVERVMGLVSKQKKTDVQEKEAAKDPASADKSKAGSAPIAFENLDAATKEKVESYLNADQNQKTQDGVCAVSMFFCFAVVYLLFLALNLRVESNYAVKRAIDTAIYDTSVVYGEPSKGQDDSMAWGDITNLNQAKHWITTALPQVIFNSTSARSQQVAQDEGIRKDKLVCIRNWNCLVWGKDDPDGPSKIIRITQRRAIEEDNDGMIGKDYPADKYAYVGSSLDDPKPYPRQVLATKSRALEALDPFSEPNEELEQTTGSTPPLMYDGAGCIVNAPGKGGFKRQGGIVCSFDAEYSAFTRQMQGIANDQFFSTQSASFVIEFTLYNANEDMISYIILVFIVDPSGTVTKNMQAMSMKLFNTAYFWDESSAILIRILPGIIYLILVCCFMYFLYADFMKEYQRKRLNESPNKLGALIEFFLKDAFNALECASITISIVSAILFILWLEQETKMKSKVKNAQNGEYEEFLFYCSDLGFAAELYNRLSAINVLMIFVRPLKFVRENARIAKLNLTLWEAGTDISWFVAMLVVTIFGFVMFTVVSFGPYMKECSTVFLAFRYCFNYMLGNFELQRLLHANPVMGVVMMPYLVIMYCVMSNIFFAIIDRFFISAEPPPFQWKRKLKPIFQRICRCIEWDEDYVMEQDPNAEKKQGPPSRRFRAQEAQQRIQEIRQNGTDTGASSVQRKSKTLNDVCDVDERMSDVIHWSRDEARKLVEEFNSLIDKKGGVKNDEDFIKREVMQSNIKMKLDNERKDKEEQFRHMLYATKVREQMAMRDQETLAKYVLLLESKLKTKMVQQHTLKTEVTHLKGEEKRMRYSKDEEENNKDDMPDFAGANTLMDAMDNIDEQSVSSESKSEEGSAGEQEVIEDEPAEDLNMGDATRNPDAVMVSHGARKANQLVDALGKLNEENEEDVG